MGVYSQSGRPMAFAAPLLDPDALLLTRLEGSEGLSQLFHFRLDLLAETPVPFPSLLGQPVSVRLDAPGCPRRHVHGILRSLTQGGQVTDSWGQATFTRYRAELVPRLWLLSRRAQSRVFQRSTVPDILSGVFREWGLDVRQAGLGSYPSAITACSTGRVIWPSSAGSWRTRASGTISSTPRRATRSFWEIPRMHTPTCQEGRSWSTTTAGEGCARRCV